MEEVRGVTLESCLEDMGREDLESIVTQLRSNHPTIAIFAERSWGARLNHERAVL